MTFLTFQQALDLLLSSPSEFATPESLRTLVAQVDATNSTGTVTVLYSGHIAPGVSGGQVVKGMLANGENIRVLDNTDAGRLLDRPEFRIAVARAHGVDVENFVAKEFSSPEKTAANNFLYSGTNPDGTKITGVWEDVSVRFVAATHGEVRTLVGGADPERVFATAEVQALRANLNSRRHPRRSAAGPARVADIRSSARPIRSLERPP